MERNRHSSSALSNEDPNLQFYQDNDFAPIVQFQVPAGETAAPVAEIGPAVPMAASAQPAIAPAGGAMAAPPAASATSPGQDALGRDVLGQATVSDAPPAASATSPETDLAPATANFWLSKGPAPGINGQENVPPNNQINGAIQAIAVDPTNANVMYVGSVNGGIWKTTNATAASPKWVPLTDKLPSLSIGALELDPTDATHQTLIAGIGSTSSFFLSDQLTGVLRSTDGGATWSQLGNSAANLKNENITSVAARGAILLAAADNVWGGGLGKGLFRSTDSGANWTLISDGAHGLPNLTSVSDIVGDPLNSNVLYAGVIGANGGVFKSTDTGLTWTPITSGIGIINGTTDKILLAVHHDATNLDVFAFVDNSGTLSGVFRSVNGGNFVALDVPSGGTQGTVHGSIAADPTNPDLVYVGFGGGSPNYLTRIDASKPSGSQITNISGGTFGSPHVDPRAMQIDANGNLILGNDGGVFRLPTPTGNAGVWSAIVGDMSVFELHSIAYDHISHIIMAGSQDNGTLFQVPLMPGGTTWDKPAAPFGTGDGGDVVIDDVSLAAAGRSIRYSSSQNLLLWTRQVYDSANVLVSTTVLSGNISPIPDPTFATPVELNNVDPTRLLVGGSANIYTSPNQGTTLTSIANIGVNGIAGLTLGNGGGGVMVYGGFQGAVPNADLIYAASGSNIVRQTTAGGGFTTTSPAGASTIRGVTDNPTNWATVFAIDDNQIFESTNMGGTWVDVTANLTSISAADFRSIEYVHGQVDDALVVGTSSGVFIAKVSALGFAPSWSRFGGNLPDVITYDLEYDAADNVLVAGTMGRGAWLVNNATTTLGLDGVISVNFGPPTFQLNAFGPGGGWTSQNLFPRELADINKDGDADIVGFGAFDVYVSSANGTGGFQGPVPANTPFWGAQTGGWSSQDAYPRLLADVTNVGSADVGSADIVGFATNGVWVSAANGTGGFFGPTFANGTSFWGAQSGGWSSQDTYTRELADVNHDQIADLVGFAINGVWVSLDTSTNGIASFAGPTFANGTSFWGVQTGGWSSQDKYPRFMADVNRDGDADIVGFAQNGVWVSLNTSTPGNPTSFAAAGFVNGTSFWGAQTGGWSSQDAYPRSIADVNGDGRPDIVGFAQNGVWASLNTSIAGSVSFAAAGFVNGTSFWGAQTGGWSSNDLYPRELANITTGDPKADIVGFASNGVWTSAATASASTMAAAGGSPSNTMTGGGDKLQLDPSPSFSGTVASMAGPDTLAPVQTPMSSGSGSGGTLSATDGASSANIALLGNYLASTFVPSSDGNGGASMVASQAGDFGQNTLLAQPQHT
jgi:hypothetical protein